MQLSVESLPVLHHSADYIFILLRILISLKNENRLS